MLFLKCLFIIYKNNIFNNKAKVIKLGLAQRIDPVAELVRARWKIDMSKNSAKPIRLVGDPGYLAKLGRNLFFFQMCFFSQKPLFFIFFFCWLLTIFKVHCINTRRKFYFFNMKFESLYYIYSMFTGKKIIYF